MMLPCAPSLQLLTLGRCQDESAWEKHYDKKHRPSFSQLAEMQLKTPVRLAPGETRGLYGNQPPPPSTTMISPSVPNPPHRNGTLCPEMAHRDSAP